MTGAITIMEVLTVWFVVALVGGVLVGKLLKHRSTR